MKKTRQALTDAIGNSRKREALEKEFSDRFEGFKKVVDPLDKEGLLALREVYSKMSIPAYDRASGINEAFIKDRVDYIEGKLK